MDLRDKFSLVEEGLDVDLGDADLMSAALLLRSWSGPSVPPIVLAPWILIGAWYGGLWVGLLSTALNSIAAAYFLLPPFNSFWIGEPDDRMHLATLALLGVLISWLCESRRRTAIRLESAVQETQRLRADTRDCARRLAEADIKIARAALLEEAALVGRFRLIGELRLAALAFCGGDLFLGLTCHGIGFVVLLAIVAGLLPELLALLELLLGLSAIDLVGMHRGLGQDRHALWKDLDETPGDEELLVAGGAAVEAHLACAKLSQQRRSAVERLEVARHGREFDRFCGCVQEDTVWRNQPYRQQSGLWCICHEYLRG